MPGRERELFGPWLLRQINSSSFEGVYWLDEGCTVFRLPWKHLNMRNKDERDYGIFKAWAINTRKYNPDCQDIPTWKTNFRCALNSVCYLGRRLFTEFKDNSSDPSDPHKIYRFNGMHEDLLSSDLFSAASAVASATAAVTGNNFRNEVEEDEDYMLRISPDFVRSTPFTDSQESEVIEELMKNILLDSGENCIQQVLNLSQIEYPQAVPVIDQVFTQSTQEQWTQAQQAVPCLTEPLPGYTTETHEQCSQHQVYSPYAYLPNNHVYQPITGLPNGHVTALYEAQACQPSGFTEQSTQHAVYNPLPNGYSTDVPGVGQSPDYAYHTPVEEVVESSPVGHVPTVVTDHGAASTQQAPVTSHPPQREMTSLSSWEVTVYYRGMEVLKKNVSGKFLITQDVPDPGVEAADVVQFPDTDKIADQQQCMYTNEILNSVGKGLFIEVSTEDYKVYATRMGKARVFWGLSESLETKENASKAHFLSRDIETAVFDFQRFWEELKDYSAHKRSSPDYTINMSFGQSLFQPAMKRLVLVKLVPHFCTHWHEAAQREGASSLHTESVNLQLSNGSSFNSFDFNAPCLMDIDLHDLLNL